MTETNQRELAQLEQRDHMPKRSEAELALVVAEVVSRREDGAITQVRAIRDATDEDLEQRGWRKEVRDVETTPDEKRMALAALREMFPKQFEVVMLYLEGHTQEAIAERIGVSQPRVSQALARGAINLEKLQARIVTRRAGKRNNS